MVAIIFIIIKFIIMVIIINFNIKIKFMIFKKAI